MNGANYKNSDEISITVSNEDKKKSRNIETKRKHIDRPRYVPLKVSIIPVSRYHLFRVQCEIGGEGETLDFVAFVRIYYAPRPI